MKRYTLKSSTHANRYVWNRTVSCTRHEGSGGFRKGGSATGARSAPANFWVGTLTSGHAGSPN